MTNIIFVSRVSTHSQTTIPRSQGCWKYSVVTRFRMTHSIVFPRGVEGKAVSRIDFDRHFRRGEEGKIGKRGTRTHRLHVDYYQFKFQFQFQFHRSVSKAWHSEPDIPFGRGNLAELDYKPSLPAKHDPPPPCWRSFIVRSEGPSLHRWVFSHCETFIVANEIVTS